MPLYGRVFYHKCACIRPVFQLQLEDALTRAAWREENLPKRSIIGHEYPLK